MNGVSDSKQKLINATLAHESSYIPTFEYNARLLLFQAFECEYDEVILNSITTNKTSFFTVYVRRNDLAQRDTDSYE